MSRTPIQPSEPALETDPRFPSGRWTGFWLQRAYIGRQYMSLILRFSTGSISGEGSDVVGDFQISGTYDLTSGACAMSKKYVAAHRVDYQGRNDGDGLWIWGLWHLAGDRGGFHLWPDGQDDPTQRKLRAQERLPVESPTVRLKPGELIAPGVDR